MPPPPSQTLIVVDDADTIVRYAPREECHTGDGLHHRAIMLMVFNAQGRVLLQNRKHRLFDGLWDGAGATHPLHTDAGDESYEQSGTRCLREEWDMAAP